MSKIWIRRKFRRIVYSALALVLGLLALSALTEIGLRLAGRWLARNPPQATSTDLTYHTADAVILCVGDSHTQGIGAPEGFDYPTQLSNLLKKKYPTEKFSVMNYGHAGYNSSQAADSVFTFSRDCSCWPDIIIFNAGKNNDHNFTQARFLPEDVKNLDPTGQLKYLLANSRTFRLGQITVSRLRQALETGVEEYDLRWDKALNVRGAAEQDLIKRWIARDISLLQERTRKEGALLVLLNYYGPTSFVDPVFAEAAHSENVIFIDADRFGMAYLPRSAARKFVAPDGHPNQFGYALIAKFVLTELEKRGVIPIK